MSLTVRIPTTLRSLTAGESKVQTTGTTVQEALSNLEAAYPGFSERLLEEDGSLRRFVNIFLADDDIRFLQGLDTPIAPGSTLSIVPAVAGG